MRLRASTVELASDLTISYATTGDPSDPTVVLLPGPVDSWRSYESVLELFPPSISAVGVSQRGCGDSDKPETGYRVEDLASDLIPLLDGLGIGRAVVVGHSGSCLVARRVALDHPHRVAGLVLEASPVTLRGNTDLQQFIDTVVSTLHDPIDPAFARDFVVDTSSGDLPHELVETFVTELLKVPAHVWKGTFAGLQAYDDVAELDRIAAPTLLIWGDTDELVTRRMQDTLVGHLRDVELRIYDGVGHTPRWEQPARFAADVAAFVERSAGRHD